MSKTEEKKTDEQFYARVDTHIAIANGYVKSKVEPTFESNSFMFAASRFNTWLAASGYANVEDFANEKEKILDFFLNQYKLMLDENLDDYIKNFDKYMNPPKES
ncbi:MAG TPA: DUF3144 domain-containing protein [Sulfurovum sp.]|nr:DUF3144 domain-containing protein [Sulfurovum sp.]